MARVWPCAFASRMQRVRVLWHAYGTGLSCGTCTCTCTLRWSLSHQAILSMLTSRASLRQRGARKLLASGFTRKIIPVDDFFSLLFTKHEVQPGLVREP